MNGIGYAAGLLLCCSSVLAQEKPWRLASGTEGIAIADIDIFLSDPDTMYAFGDRFLRSEDRGEHWDTLPGPATDIGALRVDPFNSRIIYTSHYGLDPDANDISISIDGGITWDRVFIGRGFPVPIVEIDPVDRRTTYVGVGPGMIFRTSDFGENWELLPGPSVIQLLDLAIAPSDNNVMVAGTYTQAFKSTDRGTTWTSLSLGVPFQIGVKFVFDPHDHNIIYAGVSSFGPTAGGVYKSTDGGVTWSEKNVGLTSDDWQILAIAVHPKRPNELFLGVVSVTNRGLMRSTNSGEAWEPYTNGLPDSTSVRSIVFDTTMNKMVVSVGGLFSNGIYLLDEGTTRVDAASDSPPNDLSLLPNYPNPFNNTTVIPFSLSRRGRVALKVYSLLGDIVETLIDEEKDAGLYRTSFNSRNLASGVYFVSLEIPGVSQTRPIILIK